MLYAVLFMPSLERLCVKVPVLAKVLIVFAFCRARVKILAKKISFIYNEQTGGSSEYNDELLPCSREFLRYVCIYALYIPLIKFMLLRSWNLCAPRRAEHAIVDIQLLLAILAMIHLVMLSKFRLDRYIVIQGPS